MPAKKTSSTKGKTTTRSAFAAGSVAAQPLRDNNYKAIHGPDGKRVAQVSDRASGAILEGLPDEVEAAAAKALKESGKGGTGRYVVGESDVDKARELINAAHAARVRAIQAKQAADKPKPAEGKRGRALPATSASANVLA
jgi:hypothetical protein